MPAYWIADPVAGRMTVLELEGGAYVERAVVEARRNGLGVEELVTMIWEVAAEDAREGAPSPSVMRRGEEEGAA